MLALLFAACFPRLEPPDVSDTEPPGDDSGTPLVESRCGDGEDDDGDGDTDCDDADCIDARVCEDPDTDEPDDTDTDTEPDEETDCDDGRDDDDDGEVDCDDTDCVGTSACEEPEECWDVDADDALGAEIASGTATGNDGSGSCGGGSTADAFVAWTAPSNGTFTFDTVGSAVATDLWVNEETCDGAELECNDSVFDDWSQLSIELDRGEVVVIGVEAAGAWVLNAWEGDCPAYSVGSTLGIEGTTSAGTDLSSTICSYDPESALTLRWIAPSTGTWTFSTEDSSFDTILALYQDSCDGAEIACNDDDPDGGTTSELSAYLIEGEVVTIALGGYLGATGSYLLTISAG